MPINKSSVLAAVDAALVQVALIEGQFTSANPAVNFGPLQNCQRLREFLASIADDVRNGRNDY